MKISEEAVRTKLIGESRQRNPRSSPCIIQVVGRSWRRWGSAFSQPVTARLAWSIASLVRCPLSSKRHTTFSDFAAW